MNGAQARLAARDRVYYDFPGPASGIRACLSLKKAGSMRYEPGTDNPEREAFVSSLGYPGKRCLAFKQVHSRRVVLVDNPRDAGIEAADGLLLRNTGFAASVTVADCMPVWLLDRRLGVFGVLHSGWAGTGIVEEALGILASIGGRASDVSAILGPCIGPCCYAVPPERAVSFMDSFGSEAAREEGPSWRLDLAAANEGILRRAGVGSWTRVGACTACGEEFGSSRREGRASFTRMIAVAGVFA